MKIGHHKPQQDKKGGTVIKKVVGGILFFMGALFVLGDPAWAGFKYVGADKCKLCHNTQAMGKMHDKWMASPHAKAFAVLASDTAKAVAKKLGIEDPQKSEKCLKCHTVDFEAHKAQAPDMAWAAEGIGCEECHGPGEKYKTLSVMKDKKLSATNGLLKPTEKTCLKCHNNPENPFNKPFVFAEAYKKIEHKKPTTAK